MRRSRHVRVPSGRQPIRVFPGGEDGRPLPCYEAEMFPLGPLGIGPFAAARRVSPDGLPWFLLGPLLPDLIDKPLYYALRLALGHPAWIVVGTRTFGHTLLFVLLLFAVLPRRIGAALSLGMLTHLSL